MESPTNGALLGSSKADTRTGSNEMHVSEALQVFLEDYVWLRGYSKSTGDNYKLAINSFIKCVGDVDVTKIDLDDIKRYKSHLEATHETNGVCAYLYRLRLFLRFCKRKWGLDVDLEDLVIPKRCTKLPRFIKPDEVQLLIDSVPDNRFEWIRFRNKAIIALLYSSGVRVGEMSRIRKKDIRGNEIIIRGKGNKERIVFFDTRSKLYLDQYLSLCPNKSEYLFSTNKGGGIGKSCLETILKQACCNSGLSQRVSPHTLRHSFATTLLDHNVNLRHIQELLGHADISTTQIYTHTSVKNIKSDFQRVFK